ncbi:MAG: 1-acyl-sn-glycerol-3-phosphate acyltransferase [Oscillospiraceae bacterium]|nr:1-acyl-sn-glycerol-3-phosphate acyltransferase [Oscillospiraceae bacterium]MBQ4101916.1 1-acyl-sn-glycerol-3-phosphate acyltransferase [Oscillospiraceae bacterium]
MGLMSKKAFRSFWRPFVRCVSSLANFVRVEGLENIPDHHVLICANHRGLLDPFFIVSFLEDVPFFMAKDELFHIPLLKDFLRYAHAFPVKRGESDLASVQESVRLLKEGKNLLVFPEGTRSRSGDMLPPKTGVSLLAARSGCDVLPVAICYRNNKKRFWNPVTVRFGPVIKNEELKLKEGKRSIAYTNGANLIMTRIAGLMPPVNGEAIRPALAVHKSAGGEE